MLTILIMSAILPVSSYAVEVKDRYSDPNCEKTIQGLNDTIQKKVEDFKQIQEDTAVKSEDVLSELDACIKQVGTSIYNPFKKPSNPLDGLAEKLCDKALDTLKSKTDPLTNAVNGFKISDPYGLFEYNPNVQINDSGEFTNDSTISTDPTASKLWQEINKIEL